MIRRKILLIVWVSTTCLFGAGCRRKTPPAPVEVGHGTSGGQAYTLDLDNATAPTGLRTSSSTSSGTVSKETRPSQQVTSRSTRPGSTGTKEGMSRPDFITVREGDTLYSLASLYKISGAELISINKLPAPYRLEVGQRLYLNSTAAQRAPISKPSVSAKGKATLAGAFIWPVQGRILINYGENGNEGINIAAPKNTPVYAARDGNITYTGDDLPDFGKLILISHDGDWRSAYAHLDRISVQQGETVKRGQVIGYVGFSGSVKTPQLHFEIRRGSDSLNPNDHM